MKVLYLLSSLAYNGAAKQALLLGRGLAGTCDLRVRVLHGEGPLATSLREADVPVDSLGWARPLDPLPLWRLHRFLRAFEPDCIHVWRLPALRTLALVGRKFLSRCVVSQALPVRRLRGFLGKADRWALERVAKIVANGAAEAESLGRLGFGPERVSVVPSGVVVSAGMAESTERGRTIVCLGNLEPHKGFREALRAADYLTYPFPDLHLHIIGSGPFLPGLMRFQSGVYYRDHMHLLGTRADAADWLARADVCWVPSLTATGGQVALEAMAAGRAVIASDLPHLREIIIDGVSGLLVPPGDATALARRTRQVLLDEALRRRLGEAARERARDNFPAAGFVASCRALYGMKTSCVFLQTAAKAGFSIAAAHPSRNNAMDGGSMRQETSGRHVP